MIKLSIADMDLFQIAMSGQCFRMKQIEGTPDKGGPFQYVIIAKDKLLIARQNDTEFEFDCSEEEFELFWKHYFDLEMDYGEIKECVDKNDTFLLSAIEYGKGIRILNQDVWEMVVTFLISQQNNIPRIRKCVENICTKYGKLCVHEEYGEYYSFPTPETLAVLAEDDLMECNLGYRSKYVVRAAREVMEGTLDLDELAKLDYDSARARLLKVYGIGIKVAECICLFALHHIDAFPIDTHIKQILEREYKGTFPFERYEGFAGVIQQYIFYYELNRTKLDV